MNKLINIVGRIVLGVCLYGAYRKTYDWGKEYISKDVKSIKDGIDSLFSKNEEV